MSGKYLVIDFETKDPYIGRKLGAGWVFAFNKVPGNDFKVLGCGIRCSWNQEETVYWDLTEDISVILLCRLVDLQDYIDEADVLIMHNASYDLGCLKALGIDPKDTPIIDTEIMAKLFDSSLMSYGLDYLGEKYLSHKKDKGGLARAAVEADIFPWLKREEAAKAKSEKLGEEYVRTVDEVKASKWAITNMDLMQEHCYDAVAKYACLDVDLTWDLFNYFKKNSDQVNLLNLTHKYSFATYPCLDYRQRGIRIDLNRAREALTKMQPLITSMYDKVYQIAGEEINIKSSKQLPPVFDKLEIAYPLTDKGNPSITSPWLEKQEHPICKAIITARKYKNITDNFIRKMIDMQEYTLGLPREDVDNQHYGRIYPELHVLRAKTGRFSSTSPNIQQIPTRDKVLGKICRSIFVPEEGESWFSLDYSNQEGRLQVHYASLLGCSGSEEFVNEFDKDNKFDVHQKVADLCGISRNDAKTINLGLSYGMGGGKLCRALGLPVELWKPPDSNHNVEVAGAKGKAIINNYHSMVPYLKELSDRCLEKLKEAKHIKTLGGRRLKPDYIINKGKVKWMYYKALNQLIQGSAADQLIAAMTLAYKAKLPVTMVVHDEMNMSGNLNQAKDLQNIMLDAILMAVPSFVDIGTGDDWSEAH